MNFACAITATGLQVACIQIIYSYSAVLLTIPPENIVSVTPFEKRKGANVTEYNIGLGAGGGGKRHNGTTQNTMHARTKVPATVHRHSRCAEDNIITNNTSRNHKSPFIIILILKNIVSVTSFMYKAFGYRSQEQTLLTRDAHVNKGTHVRLK